MPNGSPPDYPNDPFRRAVPTTPADGPCSRVDCFPIRAAFPVLQAGGIRVSTLLSRPAQASLNVTARRIAQPPKAAFVTRLYPGRLPVQTARQLPEQS
jgi:hypothetical protein